MSASDVERRTAAYYTRLGDDVIDGLDEGFADGDKPLWLNLGSWTHARRYAAACEALAERLADAAGIGRGDRVLDAGFGFAEQDLLWMARRAPAAIVGLNVTPLQVRVARERVQARGLADRVDLRLGSALASGEAAGSFDRVVSLEAAFHFDTRDAFFREAHRLLRPGGVLALTDMLPLPGWRAPDEDAWSWQARHGVPLANMYDRHAYAERLRDAGFWEVSVTSIRNDVYPGMACFVRARLDGRPARDIEVSLAPDDVARCAGAELWEPYGTGDYVIARAVRPPL